MFNVIQFLLIPIWPVLSRVLSIWVFLQGLRAFYYWDDPAKNPGWTFVGYFAVLVALTMIVSGVKTKPRKVRP
jgi:hypothetical protein